MADSAGSAVLQSRQADSSENKDDAMDVTEPEPKKFKYDSKDQTVESKLEDRLTGILCCAVCLDVPCLWMYQASIYRFLTPVGHTFFVGNLALFCDAHIERSVCDAMRQYSSEP